MTSRIVKINYLTKRFRLHGEGTRMGLHRIELDPVEQWRLYDGLLHELGHLVCQGVTTKQFYEVQDGS